MNWEHRVTVFMSAGAIFFAGWLSGAAYFRVHQLWQNTAQLVHVETQVLPKVQTQLKQATCDRGKLANVAGQAIASANNDAVPTPNYSDIHGCQKVSPVKAPTASAVVKN